MEPPGEGDGNQPVLEKTVPPTGTGGVGPHHQEAEWWVLDSVRFLLGPTPWQPASATVEASGHTASTTPALGWDSLIRGALGEAKHGRWLVEHVLFLLLPFTYEGWGVWGPGIALRRQTTGVGRVVLSSILGTLRGRHARSHLLTIHLQDVGLEQLLVAGGVAGVIAHVDGGHLGDVEGVVLSEVLHRARKTTRSASHWAA